MAAGLSAKDVHDGAEWQPGPHELERELAHVLASAPFRTSRQCQDLLRYVVEQSALGDGAALRERVIGMAVFGRKPTYDTSEDPVVRVRAADVRKRLAQFYQSGEAGSSPFRIELQPGSYRAHFRRESSPEPEPVEPMTEVPPPAAPMPAVVAAEPVVVGSGRRVPWLPLLAALLVVLGAVGYGVLRAGAGTAQSRFWGPLLHEQQPVLLYVGSNAAYVLSSSYLQQYRTAHGMPNTGPEFYVKLAPTDTIQASDLVPQRGTFVTTGDVAAVVQLTSKLAEWKSPFALRMGDDLAFGDLRKKPSVMIGGFNNAWTMALTDDLPYRLREGTRIEERGRPNRTWVVEKQVDGTTPDDYAVVARLLQSSTGGPLLILAGVGEYGTQAAAEFVADPKRMQDLLRTAPPGWESKNMESVLHIKVVGGSPVQVDVVASSYW